MIYDTIPEFFKGIADVIREKEGSTEPIKHQDIPARIKLLDGNGSPHIRLENLTVDIEPASGLNHMQENDELPEMLYKSSASASTFCKLKNDYYQIGGAYTNTIFYKYLGNDKNKEAPQCSGILSVPRKEYKINSDEHANDYWVQISNLPYTASGIGVIEMNNGIHLFGGCTSSTAYLSKHYKANIDYDDVTQSYSAIYEALTAMPFSRSMYLYWCHNPDEGNNIAYLKGSHNSTAIRRYDCYTDTYETLPLAPTNRALNNIQCYNGYIWIIGGRNTNPGSSSSITFYSTAYRYNIKDDTWETLPNFPYVVRNVYLVSEKNGKLFFMADTTNPTSGTSAPNNGNVYSWDEESFSWNYEGSIPYSCLNFFPDMNGQYGLLNDTKNNLINIQLYRSGDYNYSRDIGVYKDLQNYTYYSGYRPNHSFSACCYYSKDKMMHIIGDSYSTIYVNYQIHIAYDFRNHRIYRLPNLPYDMRYCDVVEYNGKLHILGGNGNKTLHLTYDSDEEYDDVYHELEPLPINFIYGNAVVLDNRIHIIGGNDTTAKKSHYVWNKDTDTWDSVSLINDIPVAFYNGRVVAGKYRGKNCLYYYAPNGDTDGIYVFIDQSNDNNVITGSWELLLSTTLTAASRVPVAYVDGHLYILSGTTFLDISEDALEGKALIKQMTLTSNNDQISITNAASCNFASDFKFDENGECKLYYYPTGSYYVWCLTLKRHCDISNTEQFGLLRDDGTSQVVIKCSDNRRINL